MPQKPLTDDEALAAYNLWRLHDCSLKRAAESIGATRETFRHRVNVARQRGLHLDPAIKDSMAAVGTNMVPKLAWAKTKSEDGTSYSVLLKPQDEGEDPDAIIEKIADRVARIKPIKAIAPPKQCDQDLLNFIPVFDVHLGMRVGSFGTHEAVSRLMAGFRDVIDRAPKADTTVILNGGDFTEANDESALTPQNKHPLAVDMDYDSVLDIACDVTIDMIEYALKKSSKVIYKALRANHDPATSRAIRQALRQRYRDNPRFHMPEGHGPFVLPWGRNMIAGIHGDEKVSKPEDLTLAIAARYGAEWGQAKRRELWRGHKHKEITVNVPGMRLYQVNSVCPPGRYANNNLFTGESDIQCVTYTLAGGRRATTVHIFEDIA